MARIDADHGQAKSVERLTLPTGARVGLAGNVATIRCLGHTPRLSLPFSAQCVMLPIGSRLKSSFVPPCLPSRSAAAPSGPDWIHEIKHDGFRIMARRDARRIRLFSRNDYNFGDRFPLIAKAIEALPVRSCLIDGEAIVVDSLGLSVFDLLRYRQHDCAAVLCAFDLIELDGRDLRKALVVPRHHTRLLRVTGGHVIGRASRPSAPRAPS
jgi:hypothetical protein